MSAYSADDAPKTTSRFAWLGWSIEALLGGGIGTILYFQHSEQLGLLALVIGVAQSLGRYAFTKVVEREMEPVHRLTAVMDVTRKISLAQFREMMNLYMQVVEPEFQRVKDAIISEATEHLAKLAQQKTSDEIPAEDYYPWLLPMLENVRSGTEIWAISLMLDCEWDNSPPEDQFLELNLAAAKRGARLRRVFIVSTGQISQFRTNKGIRAHIDNAGPSLEPYLVEREYLEKWAPKLLEDVGDGLIAFDHRVALVDRYPPGQHIRGRVTMHPHEITRLRKLFDALLAHAKPLTYDLIAEIEKRPRP